jgi:queuosine precursor transporter
MEPMNVNKASEMAFYPILLGIYVAVLVTAIGLSAKFVLISGLVLNGSTLVWPITFIFNDVFTEVYGYKRARKALYVGLASQVFAACMYGLVTALSHPAFWNNQHAYEIVLGQSPRIVAASLIAYFCGEYANSVVLSRLKYWQSSMKTGQVAHAGTRSQALRFVLSTIAGEAFDTLLFFPLAFLGTMPTSELLSAMATIYLVKVTYEVVALPLSMPFANWLKRQERIDVVDKPEETGYGLFD